LGDDNLAVLSLVSDRPQTGEFWQVRRRASTSRRCWSMIDTSNIAFIPAP
jgi:hypothetical protein